MLIRSAGKKILWLVLGLGLAACANLSQTEKEAGQPDSVSVGVASEPTATGDPVKTAAATEEPPIPASSTPISLPDLGPAPDFTNEVWLNTEQPLNLAALRGKAVLVEFWTFG